MGSGGVYIAQTLARLWALAIFIGSGQITHPVYFEQKSHLLKMGNLLLLLETL